VREYFETLEEQLLAPYALKSKQSRGQLYPELPSSTRTIFQRDRDRIIHSKAFRRLKHKTQVFIATESDHYRSRLTHTLEVAQISRHLARMLRLNEDLCEAIALAHDLGHTPFGHSGEKELNQLMKDHGGYEHNHQSRRIVESLESKYPEFPGLNLSFELREGLIKHRSLAEEKLIGIPFISLEAQLVNLADEIAYNAHDLDDGLSSGILMEDELSKKVTLFDEAKKAVQLAYTSLTQAQRRHLINSQLISQFILDAYATTQTHIQNLSIQTLDDVQKIKSPVVTLSKELREKNIQLRHYLFHNFYQHYSIYRMNVKGQYIIRQLFNAFEQDTKLLPMHNQLQITDQTHKQRVIADYIAGMTDPFATKEFQKIFPNFDPN